MISLPKKKIKPAFDINAVTMLLFGPPKIGKSTFCSRFEDALFLATESGLNYLETFNVRINNWSDALDVLTALEADNRFKTLVIDTVDQLWLFCVTELLKQYKVSFVGDLPFGKGYALIENEFQKFIQRLVALKRGIVFISHSQLDDIDTLQGNVRRFVPTIPARVRSIVMPLVDVIGFAVVETSIDPNGERVERRVLHTQAGTLWEAGDRTGRLPEVMPFKFTVFKQILEGEKNERS